MKNNIESLLKNQLLDSDTKSIIFQSEKYLSKNFFPKSIKFREKEFHFLAGYFRDIFHIKGNKINFFQTVTLIGPVGCGKSTVAKIFGLEIENYAKLNNSDFKIIYRHLNCRRHNSIFLLLFDLLKSLIPNFPNRGFSSLELINMLHVLLNNSNYYLILTLDEIDYIFNDRELDLFFQNLSMESLENNFFLKRRISLIFITRNKDFLLLIDPNNKFGIINNIIKFKKYSNSELKQILFDKSSESFKEGIFPLPTLDFVANIAEKIGDLRITLEILWRAGKISEMTKSKTIEIQHVKKALKSSFFVNLPNNFKFDEIEIKIVKCLMAHKSSLLINSAINIKPFKNVLFKEYFLNINTFEEKEIIFNSKMELFVKYKFIEKAPLTNPEKDKTNQNSYFLKIDPDVILQIV